MNDKNDSDAPEQDAPKMDFRAMAEQAVAKADPRSLCARQHEILAKAADEGQRAFLQVLLEAGKSAEVRNAAKKVAPPGL
jgi:hypothetical protein